MVFPLQRIEGKYEILRKLGEGGMGAVYMVRHRLLDEIRVIKVMRPQLESDEEHRERFAREAKMAIKLRHPNIAQLYDFTMDEDGTAFIVLEYIQGLTLDQLLKKSGPPALPLALEIAIQSLHAIGYLHRSGFVHRDISPDNLMLSQDFDGQPLVKLIDLGIAKVLEGEGNLTATGMFLGKIRYSAPEQFEADVGSSHADARCDLYSFGMVLYELCTGRSPIAGDKPSAIIAGHLFRPPLAFEESDPQGRLPESLRKTILLALEKKAEDRIPTALEFRKQLKAIQGTLDDEESDLTGTTILPSFARDGEGVSLKTPGTTQSVLDLQFGMGSGATIRTPVGAERPTRLESATSAGLSPPNRIFTLLSGAEKLAQLKQFQDAKLQLDIVLDIDPDNKKAKKLLAKVSETLDRVAEKQMREAVERVAAEIESYLAVGETVKAEAELHRARVEFGEDAHLTGLGRRLEMIQDQARKARVTQLIGEAEELSKNGQIEVAIDRLGTAQLIDEGNSQVVALLENLERLLARSKELQKIGRSIAASLDAGELDQAETQLADAAKKHGEAEELEPLRQRLEAGRRKREQALRRQAAKHFEQGKKALDADDPAAAIEALDAALALTDDDMLAIELRRQAETRLHEMELAAQREKAETARIDGLLEQASEAMHGSRPDEALKLAEGVLKARSDDRIAKKIAEEARLEIKRRETEREEAERQAAESARLDDLVERAQAALGKRPEDALRFAEEALLSRPDDKTIRKIAQDARAAIRLAEEEKRKHEQEAAKQARLDSLLAEAQKAADAGQLEKAMELAEQVLAGRASDQGAAKIAESARGEIESRRLEKQKIEREAAEKARLDSLLAEAQKAADAGQLEKAMELAEQVLAGRASDQGATKIAESARREIERRRLEKEKIEREAAEKEKQQSLLEEAKKAILVHLEAGELDAADKAIEAGRQEIGDEAPFASLRKRLDKARQRESRVRINELTAQAKEALDAGRSVVAAQAARQALAIDESHRECQQLLARAQGPLGLDSLSLGDREAIEIIAARIEENLAERDLVAAEKSLYVAKEKHGDKPWIRALSMRLEAIEAEDRKAQIDDFLGKAQKAFAARKLSEAKEALEKILLMDAGHQGALSLGSEIDLLDKGRKQEGDKDQAIVAAVNSVATLLDQGKPEKALQEVQKAVRALGDHQALYRLRERAASALLDRERLDDTEAPGIGVTTILPPDVGATTVLPTQREWASLPAGDQRTETLPPTTPAPSTPPRAKETKTAGKAAKPRPQPEPKPRPKPEPVSQPSPPESSARPSPWMQTSRLLPLAAAALALVLLVVWLVNREPAVTTGEQAVLILDALPWAELESIEGSDGQSIDPGSERTTPLWLALPSGQYTLRLTGPDGGEPREVQIELEAGVSLRHVEEFAKVDANEYFTELDW